MVMFFVFCYSNFFAISLEVCPKSMTREKNPKLFYSPIAFIVCSNAVMRTSDIAPDS